MALLKIVEPDEAQGEIAEAYEGYLKAAGFVPRPAQMMSASPGMFKNHHADLNYFMNHPTLDFTLLTLIRFLVSPECDFGYCVDFNRGLLKRIGMEDEEIEEVNADPARAPLEEKEKAMLLFVLKAVKSPSSTEAKDIENLRALGWADADAQILAQQFVDADLPGLPLAR